MTWLSTLVVGLLTGVAGLLLTGFVANLMVDWYRISSFEGKSGYFVVMLALVGGVVSFAIAVAVTRALAQSGVAPGFPRALGVSLAAVAGILGLIAGTARFFAHIPPTIAGETLFLQVELRLPGTEAGDPRALPGEPRFELLALSRVGRSLLRREEGPFFVADARREDGRWILPAAAGLFTGRGRRVVAFRIGERDLGGFELPVPARPSGRERAWSEWFPRSRPGQPPHAEVRFRVIPCSEPIRTDRVGPFEVATVASYFFRSGDSPVLEAYARFEIRHGGAAVAGLGEVGSVFPVGGHPDALLVSTEQPEDGDGTFLLRVQDGRVEVTRVSSGALPRAPRPVTADPTILAEARAQRPPRGWVDPAALARPGLYQFSDGIFDSRSLAVYPVTYPDSQRPYPEPGLLGLAPDGRSMVWYTRNDAGDPLLGVTHIPSGETTYLPIDRARMRYTRHELLDPAWLAHHFRWERGRDGRDRLLAREQFTPLPYRAEFEPGRPNEYQSITIRPGLEPLRQALVDAMVSELGAERLPDQLDGYHHVVRLEGEELLVSVIQSERWVTISTYHGDPAAVGRVAGRLDALLATGRFDTLFAP